MRARLALPALAVGALLALSWARAIQRGSQARRAVVLPARGAASPRVSILVPAWREEERIEQCVRSLQGVVSPAWEAIVIAGGPDSTYQTALRAVAGDARFTVLAQEPRGKNAALVQGVAAARHDLLVFLDADSEVGPGWLEALLLPLAAGANVSVGSYFPRRTTWVSLAEQMEKIQAYHIRRSTSIQGSGSVALRRTALAAIGGLPEDLRVGVDWDLGVRLAEVGETVSFAGDAHVLSDRPATLREFWANELRWRRAHLRAIWRHRTGLLRQPTRALVQLYVYGLSTGLIMAALASILTAVARPTLRPALAKGAGLAALLLLGRRAALALEVYAYTRDVRWLRVAWAPMVLLGPTLGASLAAGATTRRERTWFQGPRAGR